MESRDFRQKLNINTLKVTTELISSIIYASCDSEGVVYLWQSTGKNEFIVPKCVETILLGKYWYMSAENIQRLLKIVRQ